MKNTLRYGFETYIVFYINNNEFEHPPHAHWNIFVQLLHILMSTQKGPTSAMFVSKCSLFLLYNVYDINHMPFKSCIFF